MDKEISNFYYNYIYLCIDNKTKEKVFIYKLKKESEEKNIVKFLNKEYRPCFLGKVKFLKI